MSPVAESFTVDWFCECFLLLEIKKIRYGKHLGSLFSSTAYRIPMLFLAWSHFGDKQKATWLPSHWWPSLARFHVPDKGLWLHPQGSLCLFSLIAISTFHRELGLTKSDTFWISKKNGPRVTGGTTVILFFGYKKVVFQGQLTVVLRHKVKEVRLEKLLLRIMQTSHLSEQEYVIFLSIHLCVPV